MNQREAFEKWCKYEGVKLHDEEADLCWNAWQAATANQWQPIDTAKKEEMRDLIVFNGEVRHGQWWEGYWIDSFQEYMEPQPTHWMPLPPAP